MVDVKYRLAPEHPFPAAFDDVEDVVKRVRSQPARFDQAHLSLSGFSAGGNLALAVASSSLHREQRESKIIVPRRGRILPIHRSVATDQSKEASGQIEVYDSKDLSFLLGLLSFVLS